MKCLTPTRAGPLVDPALIDACQSLERIPMWVLYNDENDADNPYMARLWHSRPKPVATDFALTGPSRATLEATLLEAFPNNWRWVPRAPEDPPEIVGMWV